MTNEQKARNAARAQAVQPEIKSMKKSLQLRSKEELKAMYKASHRVSDLRELTKSDLVYGILHDNFGTRALDMFCGY